MFEDRSAISYYEEMFEFGYITGLSQGFIEGYIGIIKAENKLQRKNKTAVQQIDTTLCEEISQEKYEDLISFIERYPKLNNEKLAKRVLRESEYRYD